MRRKAVDQHRELAAAVIEGRASEADEIAGRHFRLSEDLIRDLVRRAQREDV